MRCAQLKPVGNLRQKTRDENVCSLSQLDDLDGYYHEKFVYPCKSEWEWKNISLGVCFPQKKIPNQLFDAVIKAVRAPHCQRNLKKQLYGLPSTLIRR